MPLARRIGRLSLLLGGLAIRLEAAGAPKTLPQPPARELRHLQSPRNLTTEPIKSAFPFHATFARNISTQPTASPCKVQTIQEEDSQPRRNDALGNIRVDYHFLGLNKIIDFSDWGAAMGEAIKASLEAVEREAYDLVAIPEHHIGSATIFLRVRWALLRLLMAIATAILSSIAALAHGFFVACCHKEWFRCIAFPFQHAYWVISGAKEEDKPKNPLLARRDVATSPKPSVREDSENSTTTIVDSPPQQQPRVDTITPA